MIEPPPIRSKSLGGSDRENKATLETLEADREPYIAQRRTLRRNERSEVGESGEGKLTESPGGRPGWCRPTRFPQRRTRVPGRASDPRRRRRGPPFSRAISPGKTGDVLRDERCDLEEADRVALERSVKGRPALNERGLGDRWREATSESPRGELLLVGGRTASSYWFEDVVPRREPSRVRHGSNRSNGCVGSTRPTRPNLVGGTGPIGPVWYLQHK